MLLGKQDVLSFKVLADDGGLLSFSWEDELACWELYLPALTADRRNLQGRRLAPMCVVLEDEDDGTGSQAN